MLTHALLNLGQIFEMKHEPTYERLLDESKKYLQRYDNSVAGMRNVLARKVRRYCIRENIEFEVFADTIEQVLNHLVDKNLLNDKRYAEYRVYSLLSSGKSKTKIKAKLLSKGLTEDVDQLIDECDVEYDEFSSAKEFARKKRLTLGLDDITPKELSKRYGKLARAGYSFAAAQYALKSNDD